MGYRGRTEWGGGDTSVCGSGHSLGKIDFRDCAESHSGAFSGLTWGPLSLRIHLVPPTSSAASMIWGSASFCSHLADNTSKDRVGRGPTMKCWHSPQALLHSATGSPIPPDAPLSSHTPPEAPLSSHTPPDASPSSPSGHLAGLLRSAPFPHACLCL